MGSEGAAEAMEIGGPTFWRYLKQRKLWFSVSVAVLVIFLVLAFIFGWRGASGDSAWIEFFFAVPVALVTLLVASGIGIMNTRREWIDSLPWALSLRVRLVGVRSDGSDPGPETVAVFHDIPMAAPANAREWAQQLMIKVLKPERLPLSLFTVDLTGDVVREHKRCFRRMAVSYGVQRQTGNSESRTDVELKSEYGAGGVFTEGAHLQLSFCAQSTESLDELWSEMVETTDRGLWFRRDFGGKQK